MDRLRMIVDSRSFDQVKQEVSEELMRKEYLSMVKQLSIETEEFSEEELSIVVAGALG